MNREKGTSVMKKKMLVIVSAVICAVALAGCQDIKIWFVGFEENFKGLDMVVQTYDEESQMIDQIAGKSVKIERDTTFDSSDGDSTEKGDVIQITVGGNEMHHVGSSMIVAETGLENVYEEYAETVDIKNQDRSVPVINTMVNDFKNSFTGKQKVLLIRSQNGTPLATYSGDKVSMYSTDVPKSTGFLIDGQYLFVYRCDYTIYDLALLE